MNQPEKESNYGYRIIPKEEYATFKRCEGLEVFYPPKDEHGWIKAWIDETPLEESKSYRMSIHPGPGYEIVPKEEKPKKGDEETIDGVNWNPISFGYSNTAEWHFKNPPSSLAIRRKLPIAQPAASPQPAPWIKFSERRPTSELKSIEVIKIGSSTPEILRCNGKSIDGLGVYFTHWRRADNTFPQPEKSESELAFEKLFGPINEHKSKWKGWQACEQWAKEGK